MWTQKFRIFLHLAGGLAIGLLVVSSLATVFGGGSPAWAAIGQAIPHWQTSPRVPNVLTYQGMLRQPDGTPLDGTYEMTFRLYDDPIAGSIRHSEVINNVVVREGLFTVLLGDTTPIDPTAFEGPLYIGVQVGTEPEMAPRQRIAPVAYAVQLTDGVYVDENGNVGIGTTNPQTRLDVNGAGAIGGNLDVNGRITSLATESGDIPTTVTTKGYVDTKWPDGPYCILRGGTYDTPLACPSGFAEGQICLDTEDDGNTDSSAGLLGASQPWAHSACGSAAAGMVILRLCCKN